MPKACESAVSPIDCRIEELEDLFRKSAEIVDVLGEEAQPLMDYWEAKYLAAIDRKVNKAINKADALIAEKRRRLAEMNAAG